MANESEKIEQDLYSSKFYKFFNENLKEKLKPFEKKRIKCLLISIILILIAVIHFSVILYKMINGFFPTHNGGIFILLIVPVILALIVGISVSGYKSEVKSNIISQLLSFICDFKVEQNKEDRQYIETLKLFDEFNTFSCDDRFVGQYGTLGIDIQEINIYYNRETNKNRYINTFKGIFIKIPNPREDFGRIIIKRKPENPQDNKNGIFVDNFEFSKYYNVYADNESDVKYLITDSFMKQMVQFAKQHKNISVSLENNNINIAIASEKNWFEVSLIKSPTNIATYQKIISEIITLLKIIDILKVELNIGN